MEAFKIWIMSLCGATAVSAVFKLLLADSSLKKVINVFFSIFILFYTVMPVQTFLKNDIELEANSGESAYEEYYQDGYESVITQAVTNLCNDMGVKVLNLQIDSYIDEEGYLNVREIILKTNSANPYELENIIKEKLGFEVTAE